MTKPQAYTFNIVHRSKHSTSPEIQARAVKDGEVPVHRQWYKRADRDEAIKALEAEKDRAIVSGVELLGGYLTDNYESLFPMGEISIAEIAQKCVDHFGLIKAQGDST